MSTPIDDRQGSLSPSSDKHEHTTGLPDKGRNAIILPPIGEPGPDSSRPTRGSEAGEHHHERRKRHNKNSPTAGAKGSQGSTDHKGQPEGCDLVPAAASSAVKKMEVGTHLCGACSPATTKTTGFGDNNRHCCCDNGVGEADRRQLPIQSTQQREVARDSAGRDRHGDVDDGGTSANNALRDEFCSLLDRGAEHGIVHADSKNATNRPHEDGEHADDTPHDVVPDTRASKSTPARGVEKSCEGSGCEHEPPSHGGACGSKVGSGLRNFLTLRSGAHELPATGSPPVLAAQKSTLRPQQQAGIMGLSHFPWSRLKLGRKNKEPTGKVVPTFSDDGPEGDADNRSRNNLCHNDDQTPAEPGSPVSDTGCSNNDEGSRGEIDQNGGAERAPPHRIRRARRRGDGSVTGTHTGGALDSETDDEYNSGSEGTPNDKKGTPPGGKANTAPLDNLVVATGANQISSESAGEHPRKILTREQTLVTRDLWPPVLDQEADHKDWALDKGEGDVLAAARRMGSVLVRVVTWNLHAKPTPGADTLREVLLPLGKFHIFAVGTEECMNSIAKSVIVHSKKEWEELLKETLGASYEMLCGHALQATHNAVFAHRGIVPLLRNVRSSAVATGLSLGAPGTTLGNKGGVGISFDVGSTSCIFVNSHLAAHQNSVRERNDHFFQISHGLARDLGPRSVVPSGSESTDNPLAAAPTPRNPAPATTDTTMHDPARGGGTKGDGGDGSHGGSPRLSSGSRVGESGRQGHSEHERLSVETPTCSQVLDGTDPTTRHTSPMQSNSLPVTESSEAGIQPEMLAVAKTKENSVYHSTEDAPCIPTPPLSPDPRGVQRNDGTTPPEDRDVNATCPHHRNRLERGDNQGAGREGNDRRRGVERGSKNLAEVFDRVIWAGDLNYRVNAPRAVADVLLSKDMHGVLLKNEQLSLERARGGPLAPFAGYREGPLNFRPTYKFDDGTDTYDSSSKQRVPAWTDRVLFASGAARNRHEEDQEQEGEVGGAAAGGMHLLAYRSVAELRTSDHRPVIASFAVEFDQREDRKRSGSERLAVTNQTSSEVCSVM